MPAPLNPAPPPDGFSPLLPPFFYVGHDLARAGLRFQLHTIRYLFRSNCRPACSWCGESEGEWGYHLIRCRATPPPVLETRDAVLRLILQDVYHNLSPTARAARVENELTSSDNLNRLYHLQWRGRSRWLHRVRDSSTDHQPSPDVLVAALRYMALTINTYRASTYDETTQTYPIWPANYFEPTPPANPPPAAPPAPAAPVLDRAQ